MDDFSDVELAIGVGSGETREIWGVSIDDGVQSSLIETLSETKTSWDKAEGEARQFNPIEKMASTEKLWWPNNEEVCPVAFLCFSIGNLGRPTDLNLVLRQARFYFARFTKRDGEKIIGVKSSSGFKRVANANRLVKLYDNSLKVQDDPIFLLEDHFDFVIFENRVEILRPKQFVFICEMQDVIRSTAPVNVDVIAQHLPEFGFAGVRELSGSRTKVAHLVASIHQQKLMENINVERLVERAQAVGIEFTIESGQYIFSDEHAVPFLELVDCRRYQTDHTYDPIEWLASSRDLVKT